MGYLALYRQWRPKTFAEMVGQEHVTKTFVNALKREQIAHAYLFSGPRGTGKTTAAKILAKALNCQQRDGAEPCNQCPSCLSIDQGVAMEVLEIDAASNRGIDEMRDLREKVKLSAGQDRYKVYIIDEVHMLTTEAFNALLKTLEEPPPKVVFILATTEAHKIPPTILSRVQRFEFHRIRQEDIQTRLAEVCEALKRSVEPEALAVIAMKAEGGLRDALSILDQCLILDDDLDVAQVYQVLGMVGETYSADLADALLTGDYARVLEILEEGVRLGCDPRQIILELLEYLRQMLLSLTSGRPPQVEPGLRERVIQQGKQAGISRLLGWLDVLLQGESQLKFAANARLAVEMILVRTIYESQSQPAPSLSAPKHSAPEPVKAAPEKKRAAAVAPNKESLPPPTPESGETNSSAGATGEAATLAAVQERWDDVLQCVRNEKKSTHAFLLEGKPCALRENSVYVVFKEGFSFHRDKIEQAENRQTVENALRKVFAQPLKICSLMQEEADAKWGNDPRPGAVPAAEEGREEGLSPEEQVVRRAEELFGPDLVVVKE